MTPETPSLWPRESAPRIVIVEDDALILGVEDSLTQAGVTVVGAAGSGAQALLLVERHRPDAILMDIELRGSIDGIVTAEMILARYPTPIVFYSARTDDETARRVKTLGPLPIVKKPSPDQQLVAAIRIALALPVEELRAPGVTRQRKTRAL